MPICNPRRVASLSEAAGFFDVSLVTIVLAWGRYRKLPTSLAARISCRRVSYVKDSGGVDSVLGAAAEGIVAISDLVAKEKPVNF